MKIIHILHSCGLYTFLLMKIKQITVLHVHVCSICSFITLSIYHRIPVCSIGRHEPAEQSQDWKQEKPNNGHNYCYNAIGGGVVGRIFRTDNYYQTSNGHDNV